MRDMQTLTVLGRMKDVVGVERVVALSIALALCACSETVVTFQRVLPEFDRDAAHSDASQGSDFFLDAVEARELGRRLFFDAELSGTRLISCGTCHIPFLSTGEGLPLSIGQGGTGLGPNRIRGTATIVRRHTLTLFHLGLADATRLFWDGRVEATRSGRVRGPVPTPAGIDTPLEFASILPLLDRDEMRGHVGDRTFDSRPNELAPLESEQPIDIWNAICARLAQFPEYEQRFTFAFGSPEITIDRVAKALAEFQSVLWGPADSRFDLGILDPRESAGADLFFGEAGCARCHSGFMFSDMEFYNLAVPQFGPGTEGSGVDLGRHEVTANGSDRFAFRTPPLRNVAATPPYMHNGAFATLEGAIRHHLDPLGSLAQYTGENDLPLSLRSSIQTDPSVLSQLRANVANSAPHRELTDFDIQLLVAFLHALDSTSELGRGPNDALPSSVPSGLPVEPWSGEHPFR